MSRRRLAEVRRMLKPWRSQLIDISAANRLLYYRDLKVAVVDLCDVNTRALDELAAGYPVRLGRLWPKEELPRVVRSLKAIAKPARVYAEEFGLQVTYVASGFASWETGDGREPRAPVLLRQLSLHVVPGSVDGFELTAADHVELNPVLLHYLEAEHGIRVDDVELLEATGGVEEDVFDRLTKVCAPDLPGFAVDRRSVIANFMYAAQAMVADLADDKADFLAGNDMVAALAGDPEASDAVRNQGQEVSETEPDVCPPSSEHLILDADGSQSYVVNAIVKGQHLVVQGPPGTGKTQTITNTVAELVANGKTVLFVAQKRAAIVAVLDRLQRHDLDGLVLDLFDGGSNRKAVVQELARAIERASVTAKPRVDALQSAYGEARDLLVAHRAAMHETRAPWGLTLLGQRDPVTGACIEGFFDIEVRTRRERTAVRLRIDDLRRWDDETHERLRREVADLFAAGGLRPDLFSKPGWAPAALPTTDALHAAEQVLDGLVEHELPALLDSLDRLLSEVGVVPPAGMPVWWFWALLEAVLSLDHLHAARLGPLVSSELPEAQLLVFAAATGSRTDHESRPGFFERRRLRKELAALVPDAAPTREDVQRAVAARSAWGKVTDGPLPPAPSPTAASAAADFKRVGESLTELQKYTQEITFEVLDGLLVRLHELRADRSRRVFPRIHALRTSIAQAGCQAVLDDLAATPVDDADRGSDRLSYAFACSVIEHFAAHDTRLAQYTAADLDHATEKLIENDERLQVANVSRVRRAAAERLVATLDRFPAQAEAIRGQVKRKKGFQPVRVLVEKLAPDVVLAAKPVWAASPQAVSQLLPSRMLFDVVLFDEASQVLPAAALPSIARARQVVVAGDDLQLPPTTVFTRTSQVDADDPVNLDEIEPEDEADAGDADPAKAAARAEVPDTESILDAIGVKLGRQRSRYLAWHYRSRDERLIATSNSFVYRPRGRMMTTFPAADGAEALAHVQCPPSPGLGVNNLSPIREVAEVVDRMLAHAAEQVGAEKPSSLGVIAFGVKHAMRIERHLEDRLRDAPDEIQEFFAGSSSEPYFVKNIERVQGDERDVVILSVGYARRNDGRLSYNWGPVLTEGGHRRVNVAITRARRRMTLVTSFDPEEVDPNASSAEGFSLMRRFIRFAATGGTDFGDQGMTHVPCNPFEADIQSRLEARGLSVVPQWGVGGYRLDFAVAHPDAPGRFVLAVEADGASYHAGTVARERDRLRQRQLEARGWRFVRIWSSDYFFNPDPEIDRVVTAYQEELDRDRSGRPLRAERAAPEWEDPEPRRTQRPSVPYGPPIGKFSDRQLDAMVRWVVSDELPRTRLEVYESVKAALGFQRDGKVISRRITDAVDRVLGPPSSA